MNEVLYSRAMSVFTIPGQRELIITSGLGVELVGSQMREVP